MVIALAASVSGWAVVAVPQLLWRASQAAVGVAISASFAPSSLKVLAANWGAVAASVAVVLGLSLVAGLALVRFTALSAGTSALGTLPGGASAMVSLSEDLGADIRLVAFMQYARLVLTVLSVTLLAPLWPHASHEGGAGGLGVVQAASLSPRELVITLAVAITGAAAGVALRVPAGALVLPIVIGVLLGAVGVAHGGWPPGVLEAAYGFVGLRVGSQFDRASLTLTRRVAPVVIAFVIVLMAGCGLAAVGIAAFTGIDGLTAYLATAPGGMDSVMIIALDVGAKTSTVLGMQMARLLVVILAGPWLIRRLLARYGV